GRHPRFALGESSTPLAALSLERLAARYGLGDLHALAAYGRWRRELPALRRGLKRGFTFYAHRPGEPYSNGADNESRLLVAASPRDEMADAHWLRADVDHHLARRAAAEGVEVLEEAEVTAVERGAGGDGGWRLEGRHEGRPLSLAADLLVDASGPGGFLARRLPIPSALDAVRLRTTLVYGHFEGVPPFAEAAAAAGAALPAGPYPEEGAAIHHMLPEGWMYVLPFDHGTVSAGFVLAAEEARERAMAVPAECAWEEILGRYPTLAAQWGAARPVRPIATIPVVQHRLARAAGDGWVLLPHAFCFYSPLFSTGIAWSLLAIERLALLLEDADGLAAGLDRYGALLAREADHLQSLVEGAYLAAARSFDLFVAWGDLYFAAASFAEASQRLLDAPARGGAWPWEGFLGSTDPVVRAMLAESGEELGGLPPGPLGGAAIERFASAVRRRIAPRNVAGLADPARNRLFPVDFEALIENAGLLGLSTAELGERLPRLRGDPIGAAPRELSADQGRQAQNALLGQQKE
ncbi:MAG TPA: tryptophan 7-halogenase, partial [Thermoanaerobaculia bacterium]